MQQMNGSMLYVILKRKEKEKNQNQTAGKQLELSIKSVRLLNGNR